MEIIKHGEVKQKYEVKCYNCGCEFIADRSDTYTIATPILMVLEGHEIRKFRYCDCPECKEMFMLEEVDMVGNPIKTEDTGKEEETDGSQIEGKDSFGDTKIPEYAETYDNGIIGCQRLSVCPPISPEVLKEKMVTPQEIMEAYKDIERRRYEDNPPWWRKLFRKLFSIVFILLALMPMYSCKHVVYDTFGVVKSVEQHNTYNGAYKYKYRVNIVNLDLNASAIDFRTNTLYHVGDTIRLGSPCCKHVTNETDTLK